MGEAEMCFMHLFLYAHKAIYITYKSSQFLLLHLLFLDVHIRFNSQCELTNIWSSENIRFFVQFDKSEKPNI